MFFSGWVLPVLANEEHEPVQLQGEGGRQRRLSVDLTSR